MVTANSYWILRLLSKLLMLRYFQALPISLSNQTVALENNTRGNWSKIWIAVAVIKPSYVEVCVCVTGYFV